MSQVITDAFASYWQQCLVDQTPVVLDEFVLAHIPGLDPDAPIDPASGLPPADQIVHRHTVDQRGRINNDAVAYSIVMDTTVGDFTFNAMYLINTGLNLVGMIVHKGEETKLKTDPASGQTGNSLVKSMLMEYDRAAEASQTVIDASTWQIDYAARLRGMDEDMRRQAMGTFGHAAFYGDGFKLVNNAGLYKVQPGQGYVGGLLVDLTAEQEVIPSAKPVGLWLDVYRAGSLLSPWVNQVTLTLSTSDLVDYVDANGYPHFVTKLATINSDDSVTDTRARRTLTLTGDVSGEASFNGPDSIELEVTIEDNSHGHTTDNVEGLQETLDGKAEQDHTHSPAEIGALPSGDYVPLRDALAAINLSMAGADTVDFDAVGPGYCHLVDVTASTGTKPAGFGNQFGFLTVQYIYGSNADGERALLMKLDPYDGNGRACWRNYSVNSDTWKVWEYAYTDRYRPTAAEVGAVPINANSVITAYSVTVKQSDSYSGVRLLSTDTEGVVDYLTDAGISVGGHGVNTTTGVHSITRGDPANGSYVYTFVQCDPGANGVNPDDAIVRIRRPESLSAQGSSAGSLTRKDYVDGQVAARLPMQTFSSISHPPFRVTYTNTTGLPMMVSCNTTGLGYNTNSLVDMSIVLDAGTTPVFLSIKKDSSGEYDDLQKGSGACMVPPGSTFTVTAHDAILGVSTTFALTPFSTAGMRLYVNPATFGDDGVIRAFACDEERDEWAPACSVEVPAIPDGWSHERYALIDGAWVIRPEWLAMVEVTEIEGRRARMMVNATVQTQHFTMMGDTAQADAWRAHYQALYALEQLPEWPLVEQWPVAPELAV